MSPRDFGLAPCDACPAVFRVGETTMRILNTTPYETILCRRCAQLREKDETEEQEYADRD